MRPEIKDNDAETITVEIDGKVEQAWVYANEDDRRDKMRRAWSWCDGYACASGEPLRKVCIPETIGQTERFGDPA